MNKFYLIGFAVLTLWTGQSQAQTQVDSITFYKDYFPGQNDINGRYLGSTETMAIVQHKGKLYAGMGNWMDYPITTLSEGTQILRKDSYNSPWVVDTTVGYESLRSNGITSVSFNKDLNDNPVNPPANLLVGGFSDLIAPLDISIWSRNDATNTWHRNIAYSIAGGGEAAIRSFCVHTDKVTGKQWLFCGVSQGAIIKAAYDPNQPGLLQIDTTQELTNSGRIIAMVVCNGDLYASAGLELSGLNIIGGLYKRIDGPNPSWQLVYQWPYTPGGGTDESNLFRGISCVPDPLGSANEAVIGTRSKGALIQIVEPFNNHNVRNELHITDYFGDALYGGTWPFTNYSICAYNNFTSDTIDGQPVWWAGAGILRVSWTDTTNNGGYFLLRSQNGSYEWGYVNDNNYPLPLGTSLRAIRTICKSPFPEDNGLVYYFGGYDCGGDTSNNTAWIYKGIFQSPLTGITESENNLSGLSIFPNPTQNQLTISNLPTGFSGIVSIYNSMGQLMFSEPKTGSQLSMQTEQLNTGIYFVQVKTDKGGMITKKFIKE